MKISQLLWERGFIPTHLSDLHGYEIMIYTRNNDEGFAQVVELKPALAYDRDYRKWVDKKIIEYNTHILTPSQ